MVKRKTPLPSPKKIWNAVSKKLSPWFTRNVDNREDNSLSVRGPTGVDEADLVTRDLRYVQFP